MRRTAIHLVVALSVMGVFPYRQAAAAPIWYIVFECNIRANIATKSLLAFDKREKAAFYAAELEACFNQYIY